MKFTLSWLNDYLESGADLAAIVDAMTLAGLEVEDIHDPREALSAFSVARIIDARPHPNADKLQVCQVETKDGTKEIVCGALNARAGLITAYAPIGAFVPGLGVTLAARPVRGVVSNGMLCSGGELGTAEDPFGLRSSREDAWMPRAAALGVTPDAARLDGGILELPDNFQVGAPLAEALGETDPVIDFEVTPNRPDWLGVMGIARDLAAKGVGRFSPRAVSPVTGQFPCPINVVLEAPDACPIFAGRLIRGVRNGPSPDWLQKRLKSIGLNPKNLLVDVTNYISFDRARPLHVYDASKLRGDIIVRTARSTKDAEVGATEPDILDGLDGVRREAPASACVISDNGGRRCIGLGGVMGGNETSSQLDTTDVFIESAWFDPLTIARAGRQTGILSDARFRFERGVDPNSCLEGLELATRLILENAGGEPSEVVVAGAPPKVDRTIVFKVRDMERLTGVAMKPKRMEEILKGLGFRPEAPAKSWRSGDGEWRIQVPSFRPDIEGSADIVEELIRIEGFDSLPTDSLPPPARAAQIVVTPMQNRIRITRRVLAARGFLETVTWSFMDSAKAALCLTDGRVIEDRLLIENPIASELCYMRPSMLPNLIEAAQKNLDRGARTVRFFEAGPVYEGDRPEEQKTRLAAIAAGTAERHWSSRSSSYDAFAAKADLFATLEALDQPADRFQIGPPAGPLWHPGRAATVRLGPKTVIGSFGEIHPAILRTLRAEGPMIAFEIALDNLPAAKAKPSKTRPLLERRHLTPIRRDFAFVALERVTAGEIVRAAMKADPKLVAAVSVFDIFRGPSLGENRKSVAIEVTIQPKSEALKDEQIDAICKSVVQSVEKATGATLRS
ncbi:MAG: phenylalanine--tRNA ligase subunit beta [Alphaproteobacteria bacterium]|nr:phenylalanine--tRNA ligase subunit beta [Alphaproteobacteria bacterium]